MVSLSTGASSDDGLQHSSLHNKIKIVSLQSTARPGCIIQLDAISDATHVSLGPFCTMHYGNVFYG
jgi:hypothetical protein